MKKKKRRRRSSSSPPGTRRRTCPAVLDGLHERLPGMDVLVVDDGSTDRTAEVAREHGAEVLSLGANKGLRIGIAAGYDWALEHGYAFCGRVDADGQHPPDELARLLERVWSGECDVAVGSRFVSGDGYAPYRYQPSLARRFGTGLLRRSVGLVLRRPFGDSTSGLYAVNAKALPLLARPYTSGAPEVEALDPDRRGGPAPRGGAGEHGRLAPVASRSCAARRP